MPKVYTDETHSAHRMQRELLDDLQAATGSCWKEYSIAVGGPKLSEACCVGMACEHSMISELSHCRFEFHDSTAVLHHALGNSDLRNVGEDKQDVESTHVCLDVISVVCDLRSAVL